jgi:hypothetical protein
MTAIAAKTCLPMHRIPGHKLVYKLVTVIFKEVIPELLKVAGVVHREEKLVMVVIGDDDVHGVPGDVENLASVEQ